MSKELVLFKNSPERLLIILDGSAEFYTLLECINEKIEKNHEFFKGASLRLKYKGRELSENEEEAIIQLFIKVGDVDVIDMGKEFILPENEGGNKFRGLACGLFENTDDKPVKETSSITRISEGLTVYYRGDLDKGQRIVYKGSVVVFGNVRKGAEVIASENIIVFGTINGAVHAGGRHLKTAAIICEELKSSEFSIMGIRRTEEDFTNKLDKGQKKGLFGKKRIKMKILSLDNNRIVIDTLAGL